ncbi:MFS transporter [Novispirillum itersonii]|uniref:MFS transporter (Putative signal transducer) n=1 Tax=Novispirillum itersonii TaxID=189 RepID=A0A7W9ZEA4_NOVIT|nr:hypothetical protein [Novispirillum itersonii]MBB6209022.1 MFS transporter (putative signal transducer) [Novispirillum itersonii]
MDGSQGSFPRRDALLLGGLYVSQALPMGITWLGLPPYLRAHGLPLDLIGLSAFAFLPWILKALWAAPVERWAMRRGCLSVIRWMQGMAGLAFAGLAVVGDPARPEQMGVLLGLLVVLNTLTATQDIAVDRHAILQRRRMGARAVNTVRFIGFTVGMLGGAAAVLLSDQTVGWAGAMLLCGAWMPVMAGLAAALPPPPADGEAVSARSPSLRHFLRQRHAVAMIGVALLFKAASAGSDGMLKSYWVDQGLTLDQVGVISAVAFATLGLAGAPAGAGLLLRGVSPRGLACGAGAAAALCLAMTGGLVLDPPGAAVVPLTAVLAVVQAFLEGMASLAFLTLFMRWSASDQPGTDFTLFLCAESLGSLLFASVGGLMAQHLGYAAHFLTLSALSVSVMAGLAVMIRRFDPPLPVERDCDVPA